MAGLAQVYERNQTHFQIGDNTNMFDWTYVENVAHAHLLAADRLAPGPSFENQPEKLAEYQKDIVSYPLPPIAGSGPVHRIPTSEARPLGPAVEKTPEAQALAAAFSEPYDVRNTGRPVFHTRFDPLSDHALARCDTNPLQVAGQAFFITNGEPIYFWDMPRLVWGRLARAEKVPPKPKWPIKFSKDVGYALAMGAEWWGWLSGKEPAFTRFRVAYSCVNRWHNIEKARRVLGYEPVVSLEEGVDRMIEVCAYFLFTREESS
jgi:sterol-4alpha-carboxylate 3-dehydrogenase (decarboxylating)